MTLRILITGTGGYIGSSLRNFLETAGYDVWGLRRKADRFHSVLCDLLDREAVLDSVAEAGDFDWIIHATALAHREKIEFKTVGPQANSAMTANLLEAARGMKKEPGIIFFSSVSVYGEEGRTGPTGVDSDLNPSTHYGLSKVESEKLLLNSGLKKLKILRLCPVFDEKNLVNVRKRIQLPGLPLKIRILPSPSYSLCHLNTVLQTVSAEIRKNTDGVLIANLCEKAPFRQSDLLKMTPGIAVPFPSALAFPFYFALKFFPGHKAKELRALFWKLFRNNVYISG